MGTIFLGRRIGGAGEDVVLKQLLPEHTDDPTLIEMFKREHRLSKSLHHRNIVRTLDMVTSGRDYYIVFEYVRGGDLRSLLQRAKRRQARLSVDSALFIVCEILDALRYAHQLRTSDGRPLGLIHRDVSPSNIMIGVDGEVKLTDFGIAKAPTQGSVVFKVKGKVGYMAPEQARGEPVDPRTDLFAVGVVLYEALVGERLFIGNAFSPAAVIYAQPVRAPSKKRPEIGAEIDAIVLRALALEPGKRYASAEEMRDAILRAGERAQRTLSSEALAEDLRRACGEDSASWLSLDVPANATLDAASEGTGVIVTGEDFDEERPSGGTRVVALPSKELTSVIHLGEADEDLPATQLGHDPFARHDEEVATEPAASQRRERSREAFTRTEIAVVPVAATPPRASLANEDRARDGLFGDEESEVRTRVRPADEVLARTSERVPARPLPRPTPAPSSSEPRRRPVELAARATFEPPVPRASVPPPGTHEVPVPPPAPDPTRVTRMQSDAPEPRAPQRAAPARAPQSAVAAPGGGGVMTSQAHSDSHQNDITGQTPNPTPHRGYGDSRSELASRPRSLGPASLAALERNLSGRPVTRGLLAAALILVLVALGIGLGVLLSGSSDLELPNAQSPAIAPPS